MLIIHLDQTCSFVCELVTDTKLCLKEPKKKISKLIYMILAYDISTSMVFSFKLTCLVLKDSSNTMTLYSEFLTTNVQS